MKNVRIVCLALTALLLCLGMAACAHKTVEDHTAVGGWLHDETHHWHVCEKEKCENAGDKVEHVYDNVCDTTCNVCGAERTLNVHEYDNACDVNCNVCGGERAVVPHVYDNTCDTTCNECGAERTVAPHTYDNACDTTCNVCNAERTVDPHVYDNACDTKCNVCDAERTPEAHVYDNACDVDCNVCKADRTAEAHVYDNACDTKCNVCESDRSVAAHVYDNNCDTTCNVCSATRETQHVHQSSLTIGETSHWYECLSCGNKKDEANHSFTLELANSDTLKAAATASAKAQYYKSCACGAISTTDYFETDKLPANLAISDISKTYDAKPVSEPYVFFNGVGAENFAYYSGETKLDGRPTNAGVYKVVVTVDETDTHAGDRVEQEFVILRAPLYISEISKVYDGTNEFTIQATPAMGAQGNDSFTVTIHLKDVASAGIYNDAVVSYRNSGNDNYTFADLETVKATVTRKVLYNFEATFTYNGKTSFSEEYGNEQNPDILAKDYFDFTVNLWRGNAGVYSGADGTILSFAMAGDNADDYVIDKETSKITILPRTLKYLNLTKVYDGVRGFGPNAPTQYQLTVADGVVAGDVVFLETNDDIEYNVGTYQLRFFNSDDTIDSAYIYGEDADNYALPGAETNEFFATVTVTPKDLDFSGIDLSKEYDGTATMSRAFTEADGLISGDSFTINVTWPTANVQAAGKATFSTDNAAYTVNYTFNGKNLSAYIQSLKTSAAILPKDLDVSGISFTKEYDGNAVITKVFTSADGLIEGDTFSIIATMPSANVGVGAASTSTVNLSTLRNYTFGGKSFLDYVKDVKASAQIVPKDLDVSDISFVKEYDKRPFIRNTINGIGEESVTLTFVMESYNAGAAFKYPQDPVPANGFVASNYTFSGQCFEDYLADMIDSAAILPKKISNLNILMHRNAFNNRADDANYGIVLLEKDGAIAGDDVRLLMMEFNSSLTTIGSTWYIQRDPALEGWDDRPFDQHYLPAVGLIGTHAANYELVTYENDEGNPVLGTVTMTAACDIQYNGTCNCGNNHLTAELTVPSGEPYGALSTVNVDQTYTGGIYKITLAGGTYGVQFNDYWGEVGSFYSANGTEYPLTSGKAVLTAGTYYFRITVSLEPTAGSDYFRVFKYTCSDSSVAFDGSCACGNVHLAGELTVPSGEPIGVLNTVDVDDYYTGGVYKITLTGGTYGIFFSDYWGSMGSFYGEDGTEYTKVSGKTVLPAGTYYFRITVQSSPSAGYDYFQVVKYACSDVAFDGSCACGHVHLAYDMKSEVIRYSMPLSSTWTSGVYKITTEVGYWSILPSDNFLDITAIYDAEGNLVDDNGTGFYAEESGVYYVHLAKASSLGAAPRLVFTFSYTLENTEGDGSAKSELIAGESGDMFFFRIEADAPWGASMNLFSEDEDVTLDEADYTVYVYDEYYNLLGEVIYDGTDVYYDTSEYIPIVGKTIYIGVELYVDTDVQVYIY